MMFEIPLWLEYLVAGLTIGYFVSICGVILTKAGKSPWWALAMLIPYVQIVAVWFFAFSRWKNQAASS